MKNFSQNLRSLRWRLRGKVSHWGVTWRYAIGMSRERDGFILIRDGEAIAKCYSLESIGVEGLVAEALERWKPFPELEELADEAAAHVSYRWNSSGHTESAAKDWALDKVEEYAARDDIVLVRADEDDEVEET